MFLIAWLIFLSFMLAVSYLLLSVVRIPIGFAILLELTF
jgi:hypothetical protein